MGSGQKPPPEERISREAEDSESRRCRRPLLPHPVLRRSLTRDASAAAAVPRRSFPSYLCPPPPKRQTANTFPAMLTTQSSHTSSRWSPTSAAAPSSTPTTIAARGAPCRWSGRAAPPTTPPTRASSASERGLSFLSLPLAVLLRLLCLHLAFRGARAAHVVSDPLLRWRRPCARASPRQTHTHSPDNAPRLLLLNSSHAPCSRPPPPLSPAQRQRRERRRHAAALDRGRQAARAGLGRAHGGAARLRQPTCC